jgi:hypothetical protein
MRPSIVGQLTVAITGWLPSDGCQMRMILISSGGRNDE